MDTIDGSRHPFAVGVADGYVHHAHLAVGGHDLAQDIRAGQVLVGVIVVSEPAAGKVLQKTKETLEVPVQ